MAIAAAALIAASVASADSAIGTVAPLPFGPAQKGEDAAGTPFSPLEKELLPSPSTGQRGVQLRTNLLGGKSLQGGPTFDYRPAAPHPEEPPVAALRDVDNPVELGGFVGYLFHDEATGQPASSVGFDLQFATDRTASSGGWLVQPGLDYTTALSSSWQFNTRLFSTYAPDGSGTSGLGLDRSSALRPGGNAESGFQDVGLGLGLGYSITDSWNIQTQGRYQRMLTAGEADKQSEPSQHQFFGGVMVDYKF